MKIFVHLALDRFGAEGLGKLQGLLDEASDPCLERHLYAWAGVGPAPANDSYWSRELPAWDGVVPVAHDPTAHGPVGFDLDRQALALDMSIHVLSEAFRSRLRQLLEELPRELLGPSGTFQPVICLSGSLADPSSSALLLGLLSGFAALRSTGVLPPAYPVYAVLGVGFRSGPLAGEEEKVRALVGRALYDLQAFFAASGDGTIRAAAVYLVGEELVDGTLSQRSSQVSLAGMTLHALTRSGVTGHAEQSSEVFNPFRYFVDADHNVQQGNDRWSGATPFAVVGGYLVYCPAFRLSRLFAARLCREIMTELAHQRCEGDLQAAFRLDVPADITRFLEGVEGRAVARVWRLVGERLKLSWRQEAPPRTGIAWFDLDRVRLTFEPVFATRAWHQLMAAYGEARLKALPLEDWNGALDEMVETIEQAFIPQRKDQVAATSRRVLLAMLSSLGDALGEVFGNALAPPVGFEPHRAAQALLGRVWAQLKDKRAELERLRLMTPTRRAETDARRIRVKAARGRLQAAISAVPSPAAVFLRLAPVLALCVGLVFALPVDLGVIDPIPLRLAAGGGLGLLAVVVLFVRHVEMVRRKLSKSFREWMALYRLVLDEEDEAQREDAFARLLELMVGCVEWLFSGTGEVPPMPRPHRLVLEQREQAGPPHGVPDVLRGQTVLSDFQTYLESSRDRLAEIEQRFLKDFQVSLLETVLPAITIDGGSLYDREYQALFKVSGKESLATLGEMSCSILAHWRDGRGPRGSFGLLPYRIEPETAAAASGFLPVWLRTLDLPDGAALLDPARRAGSSGFAFLDTVNTFVRQRLGEGLTLPVRLRHHLTDEGLARVVGSTLEERWSHYASPSLRTSGGRSAQYVVAAGTDDILASNSGFSNNLGRGRVSSNLQVRVFLSADDVVFFPNQTRPTLPLGLAWKAFLTAPHTERAFREVLL